MSETLEGLRERYKANWTIDATEDGCWSATRKTDGLYIECDESRGAEAQIAALADALARLDAKAVEVEERDACPLMLDTGRCGITVASGGDEERLECRWDETTWGFPAACPLRSGGAFVRLKGAE